MIKVYNMPKFNVMSSLFAEALENSEEYISEKKELTYKITPNVVYFPKNTPEKTVIISVNNASNTTIELYNKIFNDTLEDIKYFIEKNPDIDINFNETFFNESKGDSKFITPLALSVWCTFLTGDSVENIVYLIDKGANSEGIGIIEFIQTLEDYRIDNNIEDFEEWQTIRDIFNIEASLNIEDELIEKDKKEKDDLADDKEHNIRDLKESTAVKKENPLNGFNNQKARKFVFNIMNKALTKTFYTDEYWQGPKEIFNALKDNNIEYTLDKNEYGPAMKYKTWYITVSFMNDKNKETIMHGSITAHGAGTVKDPLSRYDVTVQIF